MNILTWYEALEFCHIKSVFTEEEKEAGWPESLYLDVLTDMQYPITNGTDIRSKPAVALRRALEAVCKNETIPYVLKTRRVVVNDYGRTYEKAYPNEDLFDYLERIKAPIKEVRFEDKDEYTLTAAVFSSWLATNGQAPSVHIQEWFKSQGVALITESSSAPATPVIEEGGVTDWPSLVQYRQQFFELAAQNRPSWPVEHIAILGAALKAEKASHSKGATKRVASELGISGQRVTELLEREDYKDWVERSAVPAIQATANVFAGLGDKSA